MGKKLGEGSQGTVIFGVKKSTEESVAIKRMKIVGNKDLMEYGLPFEALREIKLLQELSNPYVVKFVDVFVHHETGHLEADFFIVYEYALTDLGRVIESARLGKTALPTSDIKRYMGMLLEGLKYLHSHWIFHRDVSPGNILLTSDGYLKITDFGFAKHYASAEDTRYTPDDVVTIWYRPPEILFGSDAYSCAIDIWSAGCIFAQMLLKIPLFFGDDAVGQLSRMMQALGTPTKEEWPGITELPHYIPFLPVYPPTPMNHMISNASAETCSLLSRMLTYNPITRITAEEALEHPYFSEHPSPTPSDQLELPPSEESELREKCYSKIQNMHSN